MILNSNYFIEAVRTYSLFSSHVVTLIFIAVFTSYLWKKFRRNKSKGILLDIVGKKVTYPIFVIFSVVFLLFKLAENVDVDTFFVILKLLIIVSAAISGLIALTELYEPLFKKKLSNWFFKNKWLHWFAKLENAFPLILIFGIVTGVIGAINEQVWTNENPNLSHWVFKHCKPSVYMAIHHLTLALSFSTLIIYFIIHKFGLFALDISKGNSTKALQRVRAQFILLTAFLGIVALLLPSSKVEDFAERSKETTLSMCKKINEFRKNENT